MKIKETGFILFLEHYEDNLSFYTEGLGLEVREKKEGLTALNFGSSYLMVERGGVAHKTEKERSQNPTVIRIEVDDFEGTLEELEGRKVRAQVHSYSWGTIAVIIDPEGNRIEIKKV